MWEADISYLPVNLIIMTIWKNKRGKELRKRLMEGEYHMAFDKNKMRAVLIQQEGEQIAGFRDLIVRGPVNNVESFDGFIRSAIDQVRSGNSVRNLLDYSSVPQMQNSGAFELKTASFEAIER